MIKKKTSDDRGLQGVFYVVDCTKKDSRGYDKEWWQLRLRDSHFVVSAVASKEHVFECLATVCGRYRTHKGLMRALRNCENQVSTEYLARCEREFATVGHVYEEEVADTVSRVCGDGVSVPVKKKRSLFTPKVSAEEVEKPMEKVEYKEVVITKKLPKKKIGLIALSHEE